MSDVASGGVATAGGMGNQVTLAQTGRWQSLVGLVIKNGLLNIITLSLYRFWARTNVRKRLWSTTEINGEALEYTGTGKEMFLSFLFVTFAILLPVFGGLALAFVFVPPLGMLLYVVIIFLAYPLLGYAMYQARRYRMSRTTWRGVRFGMDKGGWDFGWAFFGWIMLTAITLGWYAPAMTMRIERRFWNNTSFGDRKFRFAEGVTSLAGPLYKSFAVAWIGGIVGYIAFLGFIAGSVDPNNPAQMSSPEFVLQIYGGAFLLLIFVTFASIWFAAATFRRVAELLKFEGLSFRVNATAPSYLWLAIGNALILVFTLGFGIPFVQLRYFQYFFNRASVDGSIDIQAITQNPDKGPEQAEGFADAFDIGTV